MLRARIRRPRGCPRGSGGGGSVRRWGGCPSRTFTRCVRAPAAPGLGMGGGGCRRRGPAASAPEAGGGAQCLVRGGGALTCRVGMWFAPTARLRWWWRPRWAGCSTRTGCSPLAPPPTAAPTVPGTSVARREQHVRRARRVPGRHRCRRHRASPPARPSVGWLPGVHAAGLPEAGVGVAGAGRASEGAQRVREPCQLMVGLLPRFSGVCCSLPG